MRARATMWYFDSAEFAEALGEHPASDPDAAAALAHRLFPEHVVVATEPVALTALAPEERKLYVGCFPGVTVVCGDELVVAHPGRLSGEWVRPNSLYVGIDPERRWGAYAVWENGVLRRSFSATTVTILEDAGLPLVWERPFWAGEHPLVHVPGVLPDPQALPFDPQELADEANAQLLGFRQRSASVANRIEPPRVTLCGFDIFEPGEVPSPEPQTAPVVSTVPTTSAEPVRRRRWLRRKRR